MRKLLLLLAAVVSVWTSALGQVSLPDAPEGAPLVVDYAGILDSAAVALNDSLTVIAERTGIEILVVTVKDLGDMDPTMYGTELGRKWGIGDKEKNTGVVIVVKPKVGESKGQVGIAVGYGLEGTLTDGMCKSVIDEFMIPHFKENDYAGGVCDALSAIVPLATGEMDSDDYVRLVGKRKDAEIKAANAEEEKWTWGFLIGGVCLLGLCMGVKTKGSSGTSFKGFNDDDRSRRRSYSSSSSGHSYGGGSFGGGGASGSW